MVSVACPSHEGGNLDVCIYITWFSAFPSPFFVDTKFRSNQRLRYFFLVCIFEDGDVSRSLIGDRVGVQRIASAAFALFLSSAKRSFLTLIRADVASE